MISCHCKKLCYLFYDCDSENSLPKDSLRALFVLFGEALRLPKLLLGERLLLLPSRLSSLYLLVSRCCLSLLSSRPRPLWRSSSLPLRCRGRVGDRERERDRERLSDFERDRERERDVLLFSSPLVAAGGGGTF